MPLAIVDFAYLGRKVDARLAAGVFLGAGMAQFLGWLPTLFAGAGFALWIWASVVSGLLAIVAGLVAATARVGRVRHARGSAPRRQGSRPAVAGVPPGMMASPARSHLLRHPLPRGLR